MPHNAGRRALLAAGLGTSTLILAAPAVLRPVRAQGRPLKLSVADTVASPVYAIAQRFAANLKGKTGGALDVQVYGAGQLGSQVNALTSLQTGIVDFVVHTTGFMSTIFPKVAVLDLPFLFRDAAAAERVLDGPAGAELFKAFPERGIHGLCWGHWGWRPVSTASPAPATKPDALAGLKIRIQPGAIYAETFKALGAIPVAIDISEVYLAISQGAVGAVEVPWISAVANKFNEVVKHSNESTMTYNAGALMVAKRRMDGFTPELQAAVRDAAKEMAGDWRRTVATATETAAATMKASGVVITPVDAAAYAAVTKPIYEKFRPIIGEELMDQVVRQATA